MAVGVDQVVLILVGYASFFLLRSIRDLAITNLTEGYTRVARQFYQANNSHLRIWDSHLYPSETNKALCESPRQLRRNLYRGKENWFCSDTWHQSPEFRRMKVQQLLNYICLDDSWEKKIAAGKPQLESTPNQQHTLNTHLTELQFRFFFKNKHWLSKQVGGCNVYVFWLSFHFTYQLW